MSFIKYKFLVSIFFIFLAVCSATKYELPKNPIDDPPILPKKTFRHHLLFNKTILTHEDWPLISLIPICAALLPNYGVAENWQIPLIPIHLTYLFGKNEFYELRKIKKGKFHKTLSFGLNQINYSSREKLGVGLGLELDLIKKFSNTARYNFPFQLSGYMDDVKKRASFVVSPQIRFKIFNTTALDLFVRQALLYQKKEWGGDSYIHTSKIFVIPGLKVIKRLNSRFDISAGLSYLHQWLLEDEEGIPKENWDYKLEYDYHFELMMTW